MLWIVNNIFIWSDAAKMTLTGFYLVVALPLQLVFIAFQFAIYYRIRRKGFSPLYSMLIYLLFLFFFLVLYGVSGKLMDDIVPKDMRPITLFLQITFIAAGIYYLMFYLIRFLPVVKSKSHKAFNLNLLKKYLPGKIFRGTEVALSHFKFRIFIIAFFIFLFVVLLKTSPTSLPFLNLVTNLTGGLILLLIIQLSKKIKIKIQTTNKENLFDPGRDPFILYLRSFSSEIEYFATSPLSQSSNDAKGRTFDQYFHHAANKLIGPVVALGSPVDHWMDSFLWRINEGARREYVNDDSWKINLNYKLDTCVAIVLQAGVTVNINYELQEILKKKFASKLFLFTKPIFFSTSQHKKNELSRYTLAFWNWVKATQVLNWEKFANLLADCGYHFPFKEPGNGSVFTFDDQNNGILLKSNLHYPAECISCISKCLPAAR